MATTAEGLTRAEKEAWELELLNVLMDYVENKLPANPEAAVACFMIEHREFAAWDMLEASKTDRRAWVALRHVVGWLKREEPLTLLRSPLLEFALDVADGTRPPPPARPGRPSKGHPLFRDHVIGAIVRSSAAVNRASDCGAVT